MRKKLILLIVILIGGSLFITACSSDSNIGDALRGTVYYGNTDSRVVEAEILLNESKKTETDLRGEFYIFGLDEYSYRLEIKKNNEIYDMGLVYPTNNENLIFRIGDSAGSTKIFGKINIFNETGYRAGEIETASIKNFKEVSNINSNNINNSYDNNEVIIKYNDFNNVKSLSNNTNIKGISITKSIKTNTGNLVKIKIPDNKTVKEMVEYFNQQPGVEFSSANYKVYAQAIPNDKYYISDQTAHLSANLEAAWDFRKYSNSIVVAVLDTGIVPNHPDLNSNLLTGANFIDGTNNNDPSDYNLDTDIKDYNTDASHGTHVAGIIGAVTDNETGIAGVSWGVDILPVKVLNVDRTGDIFDIIEGIYYSVDRGADIINMSLGLEYNKSQASDDLIKIMEEFEESIEYANNRGIVLVAAAGNNGWDDKIMYPAAFSEVIAVGASADNILADYSNYSSDLDILAPGGDISRNIGILSTSGSYNTNDKSFTKEYVLMEGTSMSAAYVSGVSALLLESGIKSYNIKNLLLKTAAEYSNSYDNLDAYGAILGKRLEPPYVFAARTTGNELTIESNSARTDINNNYTLYDELEGEYYMVAWRDVDNDEEISKGDYFGITSNTESFIFNNDYNIDIDMYYVSESSTATSLNIKNVERLKIN